jgi:hypothetical protein
VIEEPAPSGRVQREIDRDRVLAFWTIVSDDLVSLRSACSAAMEKFEKS